MPDSHKNFGKYLSVLESYLLFSTVKKHLNLLAKMTFSSHSSEDLSIILPFVVSLLS